jgi:hypothetical protein
LSSLSCRLCGQPITFDNKHISQRAGKKIRLDPGTNEPHDCPIRRDNHPLLEGQQQSYQQQQRRYLQCSRGCDSEIYLDKTRPEQIRKDGKYIPLDKDTGVLSVNKHHSLRNQCLTGVTDDAYYGEGPSFVLFCFCLLTKESDNLVT